MIKPEPDYEKVRRILENPPGAATPQDALVVLAEYFDVGPAMLKSQVQFRTGKQKDRGTPAEE